MKLIHKINLRYLLFSFVILVLLGVGINIAMKFIVEEEMDEKLEHTYKHVEQLIKEEKQLTMLEPFISVMQINKTMESKHFSDTIFYEGDKEGEEFRQLTVIKQINKETYKITIRESILESGDLLETVSILILISLILLFGMLFLLNMRISKSVWSPFYINLEKLKMFSLTDLKPFHPDNSDIVEFKELNQVLITLTERVIYDYEILKKFSEDASHELQTPLAVIKSKIEILFEGNELTQSQVEKIQSIYSSVNRLSRINKDLLLLTKIENNQFVKHEPVSIKNSINEKIEYFAELTDIKNLKVNFEFISDWVINADKTLIDILLDNLFNNAIRHNNVGGNIHICLENNKLTISNSGEKPVENKERMFERFHKEADSGSTGLGLAISKQICKAINLQIKYDFKDGNHIFTI